MNRIFININPLSGNKNASENVVCWSRLLQKIAKHYWRIKYRSKQWDPEQTAPTIGAVWSGSTLFALNISADEKSRREKQTVFVAIGVLRVNLLSALVGLQFRKRNFQNWFGPKNGFPLPIPLPHRPISLQNLKRMTTVGLELMTSLTKVWSNFHKY